MARQGARRKRREAGEAEKPGSRRKDAAAACAREGAAAPPPAAPVARGQAFDFDKALAVKGGTAEKLFELANKPAVRLRVGDSYVEVAQDLGTTEHSGGVVWETACFLVKYLERHVLPGLPAQSWPRVVELGSGCGLLGLALARLGCGVVLTEQPVALANLKANVRAFKAGAGDGCGSARVSQLTWGDAADGAAVCAKGPFDLIVGSDVVFASRFVGPLLESIAELLAAAPEAACWLCLQRRDPDAHEALLAQAPALFRVRELSFDGLEGFETAAELECVLVELRPKRRSAAAASGEASAASPAKKRRRQGQ